MNFFDLPQPSEPKEEEPIENPSMDITSDLTSALKPTEGPTDLLTKAALEAGIVVPEEKAHILRQFLKASKYGHQASLSMKCKAGGCAYLDLCPLKAADIDLPKGKICPVEDALIQQWVQQFMESMDLDPDEPTNAVEMHMVYELAGLELIRRRAASELSKEPELIKNSIVGYSPHGEPIYDDKPSQALLILERHSKIVNKLRDSLLATPKAQSQAGQASRDLSTRTANIMERARKLREERQKGKSIQDIDYRVIDEDTTEQEQGEGSNSPD